MSNEGAKKLWWRDLDRRHGSVGPNGRRLNLADSAAGGTETNVRAAVTVTGMHHLAIVCKSLEETTKFYEEGLGLKLRALFPLHGTKGAKHGFLELGNGNELAFIEFATPTPGVPGVSSPVENNTESVVGSMHHLSFNCDSPEHLNAMREQIMAKGVFCSRIFDHGFIHSFYFKDPNGIHLECSTTIREYIQDEYMPELLHRKVTEKESVWDKNKNAVLPEIKKEKSLEALFESPTPSKENIENSEKVVVRYHDHPGHFIGRVVMTNEDDGTFWVMFDDGDEDDEVKRNNIRVLPPSHSQNQSRL